jgi:hypothetical protein
MWVDMVELLGVKDTFTFTVLNVTENWGLALRGSNPGPCGTSTWVPKGWSAHCAIVRAPCFCKRLGVFPSSFSSRLPLSPLHPLRHPQHRRVPWCMRPRILMFSRVAKPHLLVCSFLPGLCSSPPSHPPSPAPQLPSPALQRVAPCKWSFLFEDFMSVALANANANSRTRLQFFTAVSARLQSCLDLAIST